MTNENKPDWNDLQNEQAETNAWQIDRIWITAKKLPVYFWVMFILLTATMLNTLRLHYVMKDMAKAQFEKTELNRGLALKYHKNRSAQESGLRDQIEMLDNEIEDNRKQKYALRVQLKKATDLNAEQTQIIGNIKAHDLAQQMLNEAYQTIAMNAVPMNLQQYLNFASDEQWIGYAQLASERNAYNVIKTIASIPELMKIDEVASVVNEYSQAMELAKNNK